MTNPYDAPEHVERPQANQAAAAQNDPILVQIKRSANMSIVFGILGLLGGFPALMALSFAGAAESLIKKHNVGHEYLVQVKRGRLLGRIGVAFLFLVLIGGITLIGLLVFSAN